MVLEPGLPKPAVIYAAATSPEERAAAIAHDIELIAYLALHGRLGGAHSYHTTARVPARHILALTVEVGVPQLAGMLSIDAVSLSYDKMTGRASITTYKNPGQMSDTADMTALSTYSLEPIVYGRHKDRLALIFDRTTIPGQQTGPYATLPEWTPAYDGAMHYMHNLLDRMIAQLAPQSP